MEWIKCTKENFPKGKCLVLYLHPFFGEFTIEVGTGYFDDPEDYKEGGEGWLDWDTDRKIYVTHYIELPSIEFSISINQKELLSSDEFSLGIVPEKFLNKNSVDNYTEKEIG